MKWRLISVGRPFTLHPSHFTHPKSPPRRLRAARARVVESVAWIFDGNLSRKGSGRNLLTSVAAPRAVSLDTKTRRVRLGVVCPMANERDTAERFVREVLAACQPFGFASVTFFAVLDRVSRDGTLDLLRALEAEEKSLRVVWAPDNRCVVDAYLRGYREALGAGCDWVLEIDAGYSHQPSDIPAF